MFQSQVFMMHDCESTPFFAQSAIPRPARRYLEWSIACVLQGFVSFWWTREKSLIKFALIAEGIVTNFSWAGRGRGGFCDCIINHDIIAVLGAPFTVHQKGLSSGCCCHDRSID